MLQNLSLKLRFTIIVAALMAGFAVFGLWTLHAMKTLNVNGPIYQRIVQGKDLVADILPPPEYIIESYLVSLQLANSSDSQEKTQLIERLGQLQNEFETRHAFWQRQALEPEIATPFLEVSFKEAQAFFKLARQDLVAAIQANQPAVVIEILKKMNAVYEKHRSAINQTVDQANLRNKADENNAAQQIDFNKLGLASVFGLSLLIAIYLTWIISRSILRQLGGEPAYASQIVQNIAEGKLDNPIILTDPSSPSLLHNISTMQQQLADRIEAEAKAKASAMRIQQALDHAGSSVMMVDNNNQIIYVNQSLDAFFKNAQASLEAICSQFDATNPIGFNLDHFQEDSIRLNALNQNNQAARTEFSLGGYQLSIKANPVKDEAGNRIGTVIEWQNRTQEIEIENQIKTLVEAVKNGDLSQRMPLGKLEGFSRLLSQNINELTETIDKVFLDISSIMQCMATGDLSKRIVNQYSGVYDECKHNINASLDKLTEVFSQINESASLIGHSAKEIASGNNNLSQRAEQQAANLEETASSMEEINSTVKNNAENTQHANEVVKSAKDLALQGGEVVSSAIKAMQEINESSNKISAIIGVIDEIAFQTNLLALNASVEAARAGEHGRGFSVVATEVRNLAMRSADAARESKTLIQNSITKVRNGSTFVNETGKSLENIVDGVQQVNLIIDKIATASWQQSSGIEQVNQAIVHLDEITQQNAALAEQTAAASVSLNDQTTHMHNLLAFFRFTPGSSPSVSQITVPAPTQHPNTGKQEENIDFDAAMKKHADWKVKLRDAIKKQEIMDVETIAKDNCCDFGKWLHGNAKTKYQNYNSYHECVSNHASFHKEASKVAELINQKKFDAAEIMLSSNSSYAKASSAVGVAIVKLKRDLSTRQSQATMVSTETIDFDAAMKKHADWKVKLRDAIKKQEIMDVETIAKDNCCDFGKWLHGPAKNKYQQFDSYHDCVKNHAAFHIEASKVAELINQRKFDAAENILSSNSPYAKASSSVGVAIVKLKRDLNTRQIQSLAVSVATASTNKENDSHWDEF